MLLDTHCWLWWNIEPERLCGSVREMIADSRNEVFLSSASAWEVAIKYGLGRLRLPAPPSRYVPERLYSNQISGLPIGFDHVLHAGELPPHHRDPFDRLLIAQARIEDLALVTADEAIKEYDVPMIWAA